MGVPASRRPRPPDDLGRQGEANHRNPDLRQPLHMEGTPRSIFGAILPLFYVAWWLYPIAYAAPVLLRAGVSYELTIVSQQVVYTIADIASKVVYGVMLSVTATMLSEKQGYSRI
jgi:bacteriorhodopsin